MSDAALIETLLLRFYANQGKLRGYIFTATRDYHATEDILQEIAIVVAQKAAVFDPERPAMPWFIGIARNRIQRHYQARKRETVNVSFEMLDDFLPLFSSYDNNELTARQVALKKCVEQLPVKQRKIMQLRYLDGLDCTEVSKRIGRSVSGVYGQIKRMKSSLRKCVDLQLQHMEVL